MASTRLINDPGAFKKDVFESSSQLGWILDPHYNEQSTYKTCDEPNQCSREKTTPFAPKYKPHSNIVDTESDLWGITRPHSRDPARQFPYTGVKAEHEYAALPEVGLDFSSRPTRLDSQQPNRERGVFPERFYNPIIDLTQLKRIDDNTKVGFNTYLAETDTFKMFVPRPIDSSATLPRASGGQFGFGKMGDPFGPDAPLK